MTTARPVVFAIVGNGWRAEFFLRVAQALPERFRVAGVVTRRAEAGEAITKRYSVPAFRSLDDVVRAGSPEFAVVSVARHAAPGLIRDVAELGLPVLTETPPAAELPELYALNRLTQYGARIQVAEQYHLQPLLAAQLRIAGSGRLGEVSLAQVSACHDYHGISLIRRLLGVGYEDAVITAKEYEFPVAAGPSRHGEAEAEATVAERQTIAQLDFGGRLGVYDWTSEQYYSLVRSRSVLVRGSRGEIRDTEVRYLQDYRTQMRHSIRRLNAGENGNLQGYYLKGLVAGDEWLYHNSFVPARLNDDELAIADLLEKMSHYAAGGPDVYSLAEASQDHYLQLMVRKAAGTGAAVRTEPQPWA
ncbi:Gfo/Idh/MocA family protein [Paenarthrobacter sp. DKR-5]|uniref:Gfo/Idh/MocA family protein n=1 Tax=Paenarthrobacter sp. DKR-5 TaxID=2835535 RepID=UPI002028F78B|nr:Gfo/Idh/MocA family oxidoreductase [Paenarthrobacter sp. DKR-5]